MSQGFADMTMQIISGVFLKRERGCRQANILHVIVYKNTFSDGCGLFYKKGIQHRES